jgi:hypothetical protein
MQVFFANVVEGADDPALDDRPRSLNRVRVNSSDDVLLCGMVDGGMPIAFVAETMVANQLIGAARFRRATRMVTAEKSRRRVSGLSSRHNCGNDADDDDRSDDSPQTFRVDTYSPQA